MLSLPEASTPASQPISSNFSGADYTVFAGMLLISTSIGVYYAWAVSFCCCHVSHGIDNLKEWEENNFSL